MPSNCEARNDELERDEFLLNRFGILESALFWFTVWVGGGTAGMGRACSMDLRERVVAAVSGQVLSRRQAAARFGVAESTAINWLKRVETTGTVAPGQIGGHRPRKIAGEHRDWLVQRCRERDFTLRGLVAELSERGLDVDYRPVWEFVHAEKLSHKKRR